LCLVRPQMPRPVVAAFIVAGVVLAAILAFLHLPFWNAVLGLLLWPYYLGREFSPGP
jgi:hypothetical protein